MVRRNFVNGIWENGDYLPGPQSLEALGARLQQDGRFSLPSEALHNQADLEPIDDVDTQDLAYTGWGVIFAKDADPAVREALLPLLELRQSQASQLFEGYREFVGELGYRTGQRQVDFLSQWKLGTNGLVDTNVMPYYLLLVGDPEEISLEFQWEMDIPHAVGRIQFDTVEEYANYAETVVKAEERRSSCRAAIFGVQNGDEQATKKLIDGLVRNLGTRLRDRNPAWCVDQILAQEASKSRLEAILEESPSVLFMAGHGLCFPNGDTRQYALQGSLVCSDWSGRGPVSRDSYLSSEDIGENLDLNGSVVFQFGCFSAGTPNYDDFSHLIEEVRWEPPSKSFVAGLPKRILGLPGGRGAGAVIGHIDRIWLASFLNEETGDAEVRVFEQCLRRVLRGYRVGYAVEVLNRWHANYAVRLAGLFSRRERKETVSQKQLGLTWLVNNDARNHVLIGDPALKINLD